MAHVGSLRKFQSENFDADDVRGAKVYGREDEKLGEIADVIFDHDSGDLRYAVIDTGGWFTHRQFLVPADRIQPRGSGDNEYTVDLRKEDIERFPKFDADAVDDRERWAGHEKEYRDNTAQYFSGSDILHRADSANIITDPALPGGMNADIGDVDLRVRRVASNTTAGAMNTSATSWGQQQNTDRLAPAIHTEAFRPDVRSTDTREQEDLDIQRGDMRGNERDLPTADPTGRGILNQEPPREYAPEEEEIRDREQSAAMVSDPDLRRDRRNEPFRKKDVGAASIESDRLERAYDQPDADLYESSRAGQRLPGEFVDAPDAPNRNWTVGNRANTSDSEIRTAEGDSIFNVADAQQRENVPQAAYESDSGVTPELSNIRRGQETQGLGTESTSNRWERFKHRVRDERRTIAGDCPDCSRNQDRAA